MSRQIMIFRLFVAVVTVLILGFAWIFISPFRDDTPQYIQIKRDAWVKIKGNYSLSEVRKELGKIRSDLNSIRCDKVKEMYYSECYKLKSDLRDVEQILDTDPNSQKAKNLGVDIGNILQN